MWVVVQESPERAIASVPFRAGLQTVPVARGCTDGDFSTVCPGILWFSPADQLGLFGSATRPHAHQHQGVVSVSEG